MMRMLLSGVCVSLNSCAPLLTCVCVCVLTSGGWHAWRGQHRWFNRPAQWRRAGQKVAGKPTCEQNQWVWSVLQSRCQRRHRQVSGYAVCWHASPWHRGWSVVINRLTDDQSRAMLACKLVPNLINIWSSFFFLTGPSSKLQQQHRGRFG